MKNILLVLFITSCCTLNAQNISGKITYDADFIYSPIDTAKIASNGAKSFIVKAMKRKRKALAGDRALYQLNFNQNEALYIPIPMIANDANKTLKQDNSVYYINTETGEKFKKTDINGKVYLIVKNKAQYDWKISKESKEILGYTCYRAVKKVERPGKNIKITAWFSPSIPLHYGPKGFNGLPGLILGLEELGIYYEALDVNLKTKGKNITRPKGILITEKEFMKIINENLGL